MDGLEEQIDDLRAELAENPSSECFVELGELLIVAGRAKEAARVCLNGLGFNPSLPRGHFACGKALIASGDLDEGVRSFERAFSLQSRDVSMYAEAGHFLVDTNNAAYARLYLDKAMALEPNDPRVLDLDSRMDDPLGDDYEQLETRPYNVEALEQNDEPAPLVEEASIDLGEEDDEDEPPTMYMKNPLATQAVDQMVADVDADREVEDDTLFDPGAGLRAEVSNAVNQVAIERGEPPTMFEPSEPSPWDVVSDVNAAPEAEVAKAPGPEPPTMFDPPIQEQAAPLAPAKRAEPPTRYANDSGGVGDYVDPMDSLIAPNASISYWKVLAVVGPLLLAAILGGIFFGMRHLRSEEINTLLEQSLGSNGQDTLMGYGTARNSLQNLLELEPEDARGRALMALVCARMHDEYGPNLSAQQEAGKLLRTLQSEDLSQSEDGPAVQVDLLWVQYHLRTSSELEKLIKEVDALSSKIDDDPRLSELSGRLALATGHTDEARARLESCLAKTPTYVRGLNALGRLEQQGGRLERAREHLVRALAINGVHTASLLALAKLRLQQGQDLDRAFEDAEKVLALPQVTDRDKAEAHRLLAHLSFVKGKRSGALSQVKSAADLRPDSTEMQMALARLCLDFYELNEARARIDRLLELKPEDLNVRLMLVAALLPRGRAGEALQKLAELVGKKVPAAPFLLLRGQALLETGQAGAALNDLKQVPASSDEKSHARAIEVLAMLGKGDKNGAKRLALRLKKSKDALGWTHYAMGRVHLARGLNNAAKASFAKALDLDPHCYKAYAQLGGIQLRRKNWDEAESWLTKAIRANPYDPEAHFLLGQVKLAKAENKRALASFVRVLQEQSSSAPALVGMAEALLNMGELKKALKAIRKARKYGAGEAHDRHVEGRVLMANGKFHSAVRALTAADELKPRRGEILADLGLALLSARSISKAEKTLKNALRRKRSSRAQEGLAKVHKVRGKWRDAAGAFSKAAKYAKREKEPAEEVARLYMAAGYVSLKDRKSKDMRYGRARTYFRKAKKAMPKDPAPRFQVAAAWDRQEKFGSARKAYLNVLEVDAEHARTLYQLGLLEYADGRDAKAKEFLSRFVKVESKGKRVRRAKGILRKLK